jgi:hypothetical protein
MNFKLFAIVLMAILAMPIAFSASYKVWDDPNFNTRIRVNVTNNGSIAENNYPVKVGVSASNPNYVRVFCNGTEPQFSVEMGGYDNKYDVSFRVISPLNSFNDSCFVYYNASKEYPASSYLVNDKYWDFSLPLGNMTSISNVAEYFYLNEGNLSSANMIWSYGAASYYGVSGGVLKSLTKSYASEPNYYNFAILKGNPIPRETLFEYVGQGDIIGTGRGCGMVFGKNTNHTYYTFGYGETSPQHRYFAVDDFSNVFQIAAVNTSGSTYYNSTAHQGASNSNFTKGVVRWKRNGASSVDYYFTNNTPIVTPGYSNRVLFNKTQGNWNNTVGYAGFSYVNKCQYSSIKYTALSENISILSKVEHPSTFVDILSPTGTIANREVLNFMFVPYSDIGEITRCSVEINETWGHYSNTTTMNVNQTNTIPVSLGSNASTSDYKYNVTCTIQGSNYSDYATLTVLDSLNVSHTPCVLVNKNIVFTDNATCTGYLGSTNKNITISNGVAVKFQGAILNFSGVNPTIIVDGALIVNRSSLLHTSATSAQGMAINTEGADAPLQIIKSKFGNTRGIKMRVANSMINGLAINGTRGSGYSGAFPIYIQYAKWTTINNVSIYDAKNSLPIYVNSSTGTRISNIFLDGSATLGNNYVYVFDSNHTSFTNLTSYYGGTFNLGSYVGVTGATIKNFMAKNIKFMNTSGSAPMLTYSGTNMHFKNITFSNIYARRNLSVAYNTNAISLSTRSIKDCKIVNSSFTDYRSSTFMPFETKVASTTYSNATTYCKLVNVSFYNSTSGLMMSKPYYTSSVTREQIYWYYQPLVRGSASGGRTPYSGVNITISSKRLGIVNASVLTQSNGVPLASATNLLYSAKVNSSTITRQKYNITVSKDGHMNTSTNLLINNSNWNSAIMLLGLDAINIVPNFANKTAVTKHQIWRLNATVTSSASRLDNESVYGRIGSGSWVKLRNTSSGNPSWFFAPVNITQQGGQYYFITVNASDTLGNTSVIDGNAIYVSLPARYVIGFTNKTAIRKYRNWELNVSVVAPYLNNESVYARFDSDSWIKLRNVGSPNASFFYKAMNMTLQTGQYHYITFNMTDSLGDSLVQDGYAIWVYDECTINATRPMAYMRFNAVCSGSYNVVGNLTIEDGATVEFRNAELRMNANNQSVYVRGAVIFNRTVVKKAGTLKTQFWDLRERASADAPLRVIKSYFNSMRYFFPSKSKPMVDGAYLNESRVMGIYINASHNGVFRNITISPYASSFGAINPDGAGTLLNTTFDGMVINSHNVVLPYLVVISQGYTSINRLYARNINVKNAQSIVYLYGGYGSVIVKNITVENVVGTTVGYSAAVSANPLYYLADNSGGDNAPIKNVILRNWNLRHNASNASLNNHAYLGVTAPCAGYVYYAGVRNFTLEDMELYDYNYNKSGALYMPFVLTTTPVLANTDEFVLRNITVYNTTSGLPVDFPYYACAGTYDQQHFVNYWYFQPNVAYSNGTAVEGANITLSSMRFGSKSFLTQANGVPYGTSDSLFLGVRVNGTTVTRFRYNITVEKDGYIMNSSNNTLLNNSNWYELGIMLQEVPPTPPSPSYTSQFSAMDIGSAAVDAVAGALAGLAGVAFSLGSIVGIVIVLGLILGVPLIIGEIIKTMRRK